MLLCLFHIVTTFNLSLVDIISDLCPDCALPDQTGDRTEPDATLTPRSTLLTTILL